MIERGTLPGQRVVTGTLATIAAVAAEAGIRAPAISLFGPAAALRRNLAWFEARPLAGLTVAVTRARAQASGSRPGCGSWAPRWWRPRPSGSAAARAGPRSDPL